MVNAMRSDQSPMLGTFHLSGDATLPFPLQPHPPLQPQPQPQSRPTSQHKQHVSLHAIQTQPQTQHPGPSSIGSYRSKKIRCVLLTSTSARAHTRPCDNCRSRRQRCDIPRAGEACRLCVVTKKQCTFLRERRKAPSDLKKMAEREAELAAQLQATANGANTGGNDGSANGSTINGLTGSGESNERPPLSQHTSGDTALTTSAGSSPEPAGGATLAHLASYILSVRGPSLLVAEPIPLDREGESDEELYLVGTASERDALILNSMTESVGPGSVHHSRTNLRMPGVRLRTVAPGVHFVFYKSVPCGNEPDGESTWTALRDMVTPALVPTVLQA